MNNYLFKINDEQIEEKLKDSILEYISEKHNINILTPEVEDIVEQIYSNIKNICDSIMKLMVIC